jgi:hypothetical protein
MAHTHNKYHLLQQTLTSLAPGYSPSSHPHPHSLICCTSLPPTTTNLKPVSASATPLHPSTSCPLCIFYFTKPTQLRNFYEHHSLTNNTHNNTTQRYHQTTSTSAQNTHSTPTDFWALNTAPLRATHPTTAQNTPLGPLTRTSPVPCPYSHI